MSTPNAVPASPATVTVNLSPRSVGALDEIILLTGHTMTQAINKALQAYALVQERQHRGGGVWLQNGPEADLVRVRFD